jgi:molybdenum cofactor biosynthesis enzyme MoaA
VWSVGCSIALKRFGYFKIRLNTTLSPDDTDERLDQLSNFQRDDGAADSLLSEMINQEEADAKLAQRQQLGAMLSEAIAQLDAPSQALLQSYYQQQLTQQQIAQQLDLKQYTVSRQLSRLRQNLLLALASWSQRTLHMPLTPSVLDSMSHALEEWLTAYYQPQ